MFSSILFLKNTDINFFSYSLHTQKHATQFGTHLCDIAPQQYRHLEMVQCLEKQIGHTVKLHV